MQHTLQFLPAARLDLIAVHEWYQQETPDLRNQFLEELNRQVERITHNPLQFPLVVQDVRRARLKRFPYALYFRLADDAIYVLACFHASRDPDVWRGRV